MKDTVDSSIAIFADHRLPAKILADVVNIVSDSRAECYDKSQLWDLEVQDLRERKVVLCSFGTSWVCQSKVVDLINEGLCDLTVVSCMECFEELKALVTCDARIVISTEEAVAPVYSELLDLNSQHAVDEIANGDIEDLVPTPLTRREQQVLKLVMCGVSTRDIADLLSVSVHTVNTHRKNILSKTGAGTIPALMRYSLLNGLV